MPEAPAPAAPAAPAAAAAVASSTATAAAPPRRSAAQHVASKAFDIGVSYLDHNRLTLPDVTHRFREELDGSTSPRIYEPMRDVLFGVDLHFAQLSKLKGLPRPGESPWVAAGLAHAYGAPAAGGGEDIEALMAGGGAAAAAAAPPPRAAATAGQQQYRLTAIDASVNHVSNCSTFAYAAAAAGGGDWLVVLDLSNNMLRDAQGLAAALPQLQSLLLSNNRIDSLDALADMQNLTRLDLRHNAVTDVKDSLAMPALRTLQLTSNKLTSVAGLGTPSISPLLTLDLSHNELPDSALPALVAFAATLVTLDLSYNAIQNPKAVATIAKSLGALKDLTMEGNPLAADPALAERARLDVIAASKALDRLDRTKVTAFVRGRLQLSAAKEDADAVVKKITVDYMERLEREQRLYAEEQAKLRDEERLKQAQFDAYYEKMKMEMEACVRYASNKISGTGDGEARAEMAEEWDSFLDQIKKTEEAAASEKVFEKVRNAEARRLDPAKAAAAAAAAAAEHAARPPAAAPAAPAPVPPPGAAPGAKKPLLRRRKKKKKKKGAGDGDDSSGDSSSGDEAKKEKRRFRIFAEAEADAAAVPAAAAAAEAKPVPAPAAPAPAAAPKVPTPPPEAVKKKGFFARNWL